MTANSPFSISYDQRADVLYIVRAYEPAAKGVESKNGIVWRYGSHGNLIGATVMDFVDLWAQHSDVLAAELSHHFHIAHAIAAGAIKEALESRGVK
jgi:hypothetical protein